MTALRPEAEGAITRRWSGGRPGRVGMGRCQKVASAAVTAQRAAVPCGRHLNHGTTSTLSRLRLPGWDDRGTKHVSLRATVSIASGLTGLAASEIKTNDRNIELTPVINGCWFPSCSDDCSAHHGEYRKSMVNDCHFAFDGVDRLFNATKRETTWSQPSSQRAMYSRER